MGWVQNKLGPWVVSSCGQTEIRAPEPQALLIG